MAAIQRGPALGLSTTRCVRSSVTRRASPPARPPRRARSSTSSTPPYGRTPTSPPSTTAARALTYRALAAEVERLRRRLAAAGVGLGDRVGVRVPSGTNDLYVAILAVLAAGAAYVPVDAEDPDERAELVFGEAEVRRRRRRRARADRHTARSRRPPPAGPAPSTTRGSSSPPAPPASPRASPSAHRSAAAFVDAEAALFLTEEPIGPGDRVMAGLSVAFDASCEEMWLAWRYGACLVPVPRSQVRSGADLGPWLVEQEITVVSTVPTLAALWEPEALNDVRLLIFGGEACPPELAQRLVTEGREVWNTYGPTEATVVACASLLTGEEPDPDRAAAGRLGAGRRRRGRASRCRWAAAASW